MTAGSTLSFSRGLKQMEVFGWGFLGNRKEVANSCEPLF